MKLNADELFPLAAGCADAESIDGAWRGQRVPAVLRPLYAGKEGSRIRMACASGVRLRMISNTRWLRIGLRYGVEARGIYQGSLVVDGQDRGGFGPATRQPLWEGLIFTEGASASHLFDLWLPHLCQADVLYLELEDGAHLTDADALPVRWLAFGDSITQGMTSTCPTRSAIGRCTLALGSDTLNLGIGGAGLHARLAELVPAVPCDLISIAYGTNDFRNAIPVEDYQRNAARLLAALRQQYPAQPIVLISPLTWANRTTPNERGLALDDYRAALAAVAGQLPGVQLVPGSELIPNDSRYFVDDVHPNDEGFALYAKHLLPHLRSALAAP